MNANIQAQYLSAAQAAQYTGYSVSSIRRFIRMGKLQPTSDAGHPRFTIRQLDQFMHRRDRQESTTAAGGNYKTNVTGTLQAAMDRAKKAHLTR